MQLKKNCGRSLFTLVFIFILSLASITAEQMGSATFGFSLDLPEGFVVTEATQPRMEGATSSSTSSVLQKLLSEYMKPIATSLPRVQCRTP